MTKMVTHGTPDYAELHALGLSPGDLTFFSSNINPYGPAPAVVEAVRSAIDGATIARYPDRLSLDLRAALADVHEVPPEHIVVGNGSADLMWLIAMLRLQDKHAAVLVPTFGEYENIASIAGATIEKICLPGWEEVAPDRYKQSGTTVEDCHRALMSAQPEVVFFCNPNNPTGSLSTREELHRLTSAAPDALWVVDEAYAEFAPAPWSTVDAFANSDRFERLIVLRSMTKDYALGGLRLGYLVTHPELAGRLRNVQPPWNVNTPAQIAGLSALSERGWTQDTLANLRHHVEQLRSSLQGLGLAPLPTSVNFFLLPARGVAAGTGAAVRSALLKERLVVRDCASFGLPEFIRIAAMLPADNVRLVEAVARLMQS